MICQITGKFDCGLPHTNKNMWTNQNNRKMKVSTGLIIDDLGIEFQ